MARSARSRAGSDWSRRRARSALEQEPPDVDGARHAFERAAAAGSAGAAYDLGLLLETRIDPPDFDGACSAYEQAAAAGIIDAGINLGIVLAKKVRPPDLPGARAALERATDLALAEQRNPRSDAARQ